MKKLIVVADDFGLTRSVNEGILRAYRDGIVTEISLELNAPGTDDALKSIIKYKLKHVGVHLLLHSWKETGSFYHRDDYMRLFKKSTASHIRTLAQKEFALFEKILERKPSHIIPQKGIHGNLKVLESIISYAKSYNIPVRIPRTDLVGDFHDENYAAEIMVKRSGIKTTQHMIAYVSGSDIAEIRSRLLKDLGNVHEGESTELMFHPGYVDEELLRYTSLRYERARDVALCTDKSFENDIKTLGFTFVSYEQL